MVVFFKPKQQKTHIPRKEVLDMPNLEARVSKLEKQISTLIRNMSNEKKYMENGIEAGRV